MAADTGSRAVLARLLGVDVRSLKNFVDEGMPKDARGAYPLAACVQWYVEREREAARKRTGLNELDLARQRKTIAEARKAEMEAEALEGRLVPLEVHGQRLEAVCDRIRSVLMNVPSTYLGRIQVARTDAEALVVGEAIRDETLAAMLEIADGIDAEAAADAPDRAA